MHPGRLLPGRVAVLERVIRPARVEELEHEVDVPARPLGAEHPDVAVKLDHLVRQVVALAMPPPLPRGLRVPRRRRVLLRRLLPELRLARLALLALLRLLLRRLPRRLRRGALLLGGEPRRLLGVLGGAPRRLRLLDRSQSLRLGRHGLARRLEARDGGAQERAALPGAAAAPAVRERAVQMLVKLEHRRRRRRRLFSLLRRRAPLLRPSLRRVFVRGKPPQRVVRARGELLDDRQRL